MSGLINVIFLFAWVSSPKCFNLDVSFYVYVYLTIHHLLTQTIWDFMFTTVYRYATTAHTMLLQYTPFWDMTLLFIFGQEHAPISFYCVRIVWLGANYGCEKEKFYIEKWRTCRIKMSCFILKAPSLWDKTLHMLSLKVVKWG